ncbi:MAG: plastocyanin, partial [Chloroflexi bacterium]|nr:plastocyanin [Chloroflexota bacterium]
GTRIIWTNDDGFQHTTTSDTGLWNSGPMNSGARFARVFNKAGTFAYHCTIHPFMHGTIRVTK